MLEYVETKADLHVLNLQKDFALNTMPELVKKNFNFNDEEV